jgi:hypothetical protein
MGNSLRIGEKNNAKESLEETLKERGHKENLGVDRR